MKAFSLRGLQQRLELDVALCKACMPGSEGLLLVAGQSICLGCALVKGFEHGEPRMVSLQTSRCSARIRKAPCTHGVQDVQQVKRSPAHDAYPMSVRFCRGSPPETQASRLLTAEISTPAMTLYTSGYLLTPSMV